MFGQGVLWRFLMSISLFSDIKVAWVQNKRFMEQPSRQTLSMQSQINRQHKLYYYKVQRLHAVMFSGTSAKWVLGPQRSGDCNAICGAQKGKCDEDMGRTAARNSRFLNFDGITCKGRNRWNYGQGFSQCLDKGCCGDSSCQFHCSVTSEWPG